MRRIDNPRWYAQISARPDRDVWDFYLARRVKDGLEYLTPDSVIFVAESEIGHPLLTVNGAFVAEGALQVLADALAEVIEAPPTKELVAELRTQIDRAEARIDRVIDKALQ